MKRILRIIGLVLLGILVISTFVFLWQQSQPQVVQYTIVAAQKGNIVKSTVATGKVEPRNEIDIKPQISGIISEVHMEAGDIVKTGDIIATIQVVPDMVNLSSAESRAERAKLAADQSRINYERDLKLYENDVISREEFEKVELQYKNDEEEVRAANDNLSLVKTGITQSSAQTSNTLVRSTVNGTILDVPVKVGNSVILSNNFNDGTTVASVADLNDMLFIGKIDETEVGLLTLGMPIDIIIGAIQGRTIPAKLEYISPKGTEESGAILFEIKAALEIPEDLFIRAGYSANADVTLDQRENVLIIPENTIEFSGDLAYVYLVKNEATQQFERHPITIGLSDGINIEVIEGLNENDKIRGSEIIEEK